VTEEVAVRDVLTEGSRRCVLYVSVTPMPSCQTTPTLYRSDGTAGPDTP